MSINCNHNWHGEQRTIAIIAVFRTHIIFKYKQKDTMTHASFEIVTIISSRTNIYYPTIYFFLFGLEKKKGTSTVTGTMSSSSQARLQDSVRHVFTHVWTHVTNISVFLGKS